MTSEQLKLTLTVAEVAALLRISRSTAYEAVRTGQIPSLRFGRRIVIPKAALHCLLDGRRGSIESEHQEVTRWNG